MRKHLTVFAHREEMDGEEEKSMNNEIVPLFDEQKIEGLSIRLQKVAGQEGCLALNLAGQIDMFNTISFQRKIGMAIEAGFVGLIFDLSRVHYISSTGIGSFTSFLRAVRPRNGDVVLVSPQPRVLEIFRLLGFSSFFRIAVSLEESVEMFARAREHEAVEPFPKTFPCPICDRKLRASRPGRFRCPECRTVLALDPAGLVLLG
jgi:anti-sigma B factor antagonist